MATGAAGTSGPEDVAVCHADVFYCTSVQLKSESHSICMVPANKLAATDGNIPATEIKIVRIPVGFDCDAVVTGPDEAVLDQEAFAGDRIDAVQPPRARVGEDLDVAVDSIHAVGNGVCPATGTAEEYAIDGQVFAVVHAQVPAEGSTTKDADILS